MPRKTPKKITANPSRDGFYTWTIEVKVHETWVQDGFEFTSDNAHDMIARLLPYACGHEFKARVLSAPPTEAIKKAQGR